MDLSGQNYSIYANQSGNSQMDTCDLTQQVSSIYGQLPSTSSAPDPNMEHCVSSTTNINDGITSRSSRITGNTYATDHVIHSNYL